LIFTDRSYLGTGAPLAPVPPPPSWPADALPSPASYQTDSIKRAKNAPHGKVLRLPLNQLDLAKATVVAPESKGVVQEFAPCDDGLYVANLQGGPSELAYFKRGSTRPRNIPVLPVSTVSGLQSWHGDELVFGNVSYLKPFAWFTYNPATNEVIRTALRMISPVDFDDLEVVREFAAEEVRDDRDFAFFETVLPLSRAWRRKSCILLACSSRNRCTKQTEQAGRH